MYIIKCSSLELTAIAPGRYPWVGLGATPLPERKSRLRMIEWIILQLDYTSFIVSLRPFSDDANRYMQVRKGDPEQYGMHPFSAEEMVFKVFIIIKDITPESLQRAMEQVALMNWYWR